jgi:hypothetical protein
MVEQEALLEVVRLLERLRIPHMVTGSVASSERWARELGLPKLWREITGDRP